jgi:hypothetical protein
LTFSMKRFDRVQITSEQGTNCGKPIAVLLTQLFKVPTVQSCNWSC